LINLASHSSKKTSTAWFTLRLVAVTLTIWTPLSSISEPEKFGRLMLKFYDTALLTAENISPRAPSKILSLSGFGMLFVFTARLLTSSRHLSLS
jgi:hypothetical protein